MSVLPRKHGAQVFPEKRGNYFGYGNVRELADVVENAWKLKYKQEYLNTFIAIAIHPYQ